MHSEKWTLEKIKKGFDKFYELHNRFPVAYDIDDCNFLPSARQIQRKFGGLINLRKELGLEIKNYTQGESRSDSVANFNKGGRSYENTICKLLKEKFDDRFIHIEKPTNKENDSEGYSSKDRYDFYVYAKPNNFAIDVFGTNNNRGLVNIINVKEKKYRKIKMNDDEMLYFIYFVKEMNDAKFQKWVNEKSKKIPSNWKIINKNDFYKELAKYEPYKAM